MLDQLKHQLNPEVTDGFVATTGIADDKKILAMQERNGDDSEIDYTRACRPFGDNAGLILGEAAQFVFVSSLEKAIELGLRNICFSACYKNKC